MFQAFKSCCAWCHDEVNFKVFTINTTDENLQHSEFCSPHCITQAKEYYS